MIPHCMFSLLSRDELDGFLYNDKTGEAAPAFIKPGSATAHMGGFVEWHQVRLAEDVPARLAAIMAERGMTFEPGDLDGRGGK
jgi:hypothetical protein